MAPSDLNQMDGGLALPATRVITAIATAIGCVVPLPFFDMLLIGLSRRRLVALVLKRHGRTFISRDMKAYYGEPWSLLGLPWRLVKGLILGPIKRALRAVFIVLAARDVVLEVGKTVALGHVLDRMLRGGSFPNDASPAARAHEAARLRAAIEIAYAGVDQRVIRRALAAVRHLSSTAVLAVRRHVMSHDAPARDGGADPDARALESFLAELDRRVDLALLGRPVDR